MFQLLSVDGATSFSLFISLVSTIIAVIVLVQFLALVSNVKEINSKCRKILDELVKRREREEKQQEKEAGN